MIAERRTETSGRMNIQDAQPAFQRLVVRQPPQTDLQDLRCLGRQSLATLDQLCRYRRAQYAAEFHGSRRGTASRIRRCRTVISCGTRLGNAAEHNPLVYRAQLDVAIESGVDPFQDAAFAEAGLFHLILDEGFEGDLARSGLVRFHNGSDSSTSNRPLSLNSPINSSVVNWSILNRLRLLANCTPRVAQRTLPGS